MIKKLLPDITVKNVHMLDRDFYEKKNIKGVIFDIDNTLVAHTEPTPPGDVLEYFENLKQWGIKYAIVSNNSHERVHSFCKDLGVPYYGKALKPRKKYLKKTLGELEIKKEECALVGDQLFTDIFGGNRMGFLSVLVTAVGCDETSFVSFKRKFEKRILEKNKDILRGRLYENDK
ncbi:MAG: YqeG family HAD IIIA-type phosphatase [Ruminococcaceae bacterium]|nr:YqeG family HAD IIIA-type phosphatase [Oscillospiraceae bacterium]